MAPRAGRPDQLRINAEGHANGEPPPSTYAAQIVDNLTSARRRSSSGGNQAHLRQLLQMILDADRNGDALSGAHETSIEVNYRLIYTIVRAGLETLSCSPFDDQRDVQVQALNTLAVVDLTIRRSPEVLFCDSQNHDPVTRPVGPLFLWLIPHLVNLLSHETNQEIREGAGEVLITTLKVQTRASTSRSRLHPIVKFLQGCINDLLLFVERYSGDGPTVDNYRVPSDETVAEVYPQVLYQSRNDDPQATFLISHSDRSRDVSVILNILVMLCSPSNNSARSRSNPIRPDAEWIFNCLTRIWQILEPGDNPVDFNYTKKGCYSRFLKALRTCLLPSNTVESDAFESVQATMLICQAISCFLHPTFEDLSSDLEHEICWSVSDLLSVGSKLPSVLQAYNEHLGHLLQAVDGPCSRMEKFEDELQRTLALAIYYSNNGQISDPITAEQHRLLDFRDNNLSESFHRLLMVSDGLSEIDEAARPSKRVRLSDLPASGASKLPATCEMETVCSFLRSSLSVDLDEFCQIALLNFPSIPEKDQCILFAAIGQIACSRAHTWSLSKSRCSVCDGEQQKQRSKNAIDQTVSQRLFLIVIDLLKLLQAQRSTKPRVAAMICVRRLLAHTNIWDYLNLKESPIGQWCLQAMRSSLRDLRISAGRTLILFLQDGVDGRFLPQNRVIALDLLRSLSEKSGLALQETCILTWGQIALISSDDETNIVLLRLVEYLGHTNPLISGLAYDELLRISCHSPMAAMRMFEPYWRTIAVTVVKDLQSRPQVPQRICDLLNIKVSQFLQMTQFFTVPYLILTKKKDTLQRIADACGPEHSVKSICMGHAQLAAILSCLLLQQSTDLETMILSLFCHASPEFNDADVQGLMKSEPMLTAFELLKIAGEEEEGKSTRVHQAIQFLAGFSQRRSGSARGSARRSEGVGSFFELHVLAIMALLSDNIGEKNGLQSLSEKKRSIGAIREMIKLAKSHVCNALPQICACLQSAIEDPELCNEAFVAWIVLLTTLGEEDVEYLINPTFAIIAQHWESFNSMVQERTYQMVSLLLKNHPGMVREMVNAIPSIDKIPLLSKFETELGKLRAQMDHRHQFQAFAMRCQEENATVVLRALTELGNYLNIHQSFLQTSAISEQPDPVIADLVRSLLDACVRFSESSSEIASLCARCLGVIGCLDSTRIEAVRESKDILVLSNFGKADETIDFVIFFIQEVLVKAFLSATNTRAQTFLGYVIQQLLRFCTFDTSVTYRGGDSQSSAKCRRWVAIPEATRNTLTPFLTSQFILKTPASLPECTYPLYTVKVSHARWLRDFVFDLLQKGCGDNAAFMFPILRRAVRGQDISIPSFLLPYAALNVVVGGTEQQRHDVANELLTILSQPVPENNQRMRESMMLCSQNVFQTLDYFSRWMHEKKKEVAIIIAAAHRAGRALQEDDTANELAPVSSVEYVLSTIPAEMMSRRAVECKSYSRALFYWEQYIREQQSRADFNDRSEELFEKLQDIYTQIDEPDGIEGISSHLHVLNIDQQVLEHRKAGRWTAVQSWYELRLTVEPNDTEVQFNLLNSLKESGLYDVLLNQIAGLPKSEASIMMARPFAVEASWVTGKWDKLTEYIADAKDETRGDFNIGIGTALLSLHQKKYDQTVEILNTLRYDIAKSMSMSSTTSLQACHDAMLRFHIITEVELISGVGELGNPDPTASLQSLNQRLDVLGAFLPDKQYLLGLRRASMQLSKREYSKLDLSSAWLTSARLARKGGFIHQAFNAVLHASQLGDESATIEHSRLLWREGHHRKAIQSLEGAIAANAFRSHNYTPTDDAVATTQQNLLTARAHLLLAKWIDRAGQTQSDAIIRRYKKAVEFHSRWEKGHYYLGKHYNKLLESEKLKLPAKQAQTFITGETAKLVIENYLRSLAFGAKYIYQTLPRILTLWLDFGNDVDRPLDPKYGNEESFRSHVIAQRKKLFGAVNSQIKKYIDRLPSFVFYTAFAQIVARICHTNQTIYGHLVDIIAKVVTTHPQQALWTLLAMVKSSTKERSHRGLACMTKITENAKKIKTDSTGSEVRTLILQGQRLSDQLLQVCEGEIQGKATNISITKDLRFNLKTAPCRLVVPLESTLMASLPTVTDNVNMKTHKAFTKDTITISTVMDDVLVLNSLQRPRKISIRGSDGRNYGLLCKPKDDLRKDQRLMEFNAMINRSLKRDAESSKRRLYIRTYAVTPLNEECGLIEWIDNLKTLRDILLRIYNQKNVKINYMELKDLLDQASKDPAKIHIFDEIIASFPPAFHEWFVEMFPEPGAWFTARLKYTRSAAVMSIVGHVLGLGDRHGENILFEEGNGGTLHVDFNCLFDKGLTFEKPELVPFRLTHNMVDAFGAYGYDGPFRKSCELTAGILRGYEDTLMTILETFLYDPTTDFLGKKKRSSVVPDSPEGVLESVRNKVRGLLPGESVPLSVEGYVAELITQATDPHKLAAMYIGWCAFF